MQYDVCCGVNINLHRVASLWNYCHSSVLGVHTLVCHGSYFCDAANSGGSSRYSAWCELFKNSLKQLIVCLLQQHQILYMTSPQFQRLFVELLLLKRSLQPRVGAFNSTYNNHKCKKSALFKKSLCSCCIVTYSKSSSSSSCSRSQRGPLRHSCAMATKNGWSP